jgi:hypothetical protein
MYDNLSATLNGTDILPIMELKDTALILTRNFKPNETLDLAISFESRGMSFWYLQVKEAREIRDFTLTLRLPDLPKARLNYPEGCMTPTQIASTSDNQGCTLTYRLDHAISNKGMGISLPELPQPGEATNLLLAEVERGWLLVFSMLILGLTLSAIPHAVLVSIFFAVASACVYGLMADFSDVLFGIWGAAALIIAGFVSLAWLLKRVVPLTGHVLASQLLLFGILYPCIAGLDNNRQTLYFNICAVLFLVATAWQLIRVLKTVPAPAPPYPAPGSNPIPAA